MDFLHRKPHIVKEPVKELTREERVKAELDAYLTRLVNGNPSQVFVTVSDIEWDWNDILKFMNASGYQAIVFATPYYHDDVILFNLMPVFFNTRARI